MTEVFAGDPWCGLESSPSPTVQQEGIDLKYNCCVWISNRCLNINNKIIISRIPIKSAQNFWEGGNILVVLRVTKGQGSSRWTMQWLKDDRGKEENNRNQQYKDKDISQHFIRRLHDLYLHNQSPSQGPRLPFSPMLQRVQFWFYPPWLPEELCGRCPSEASKQTEVGEKNFRRRGDSRNKQ